MSLGGGMLCELGAAPFALEFGDADGESCLY